MIPDSHRDLIDEPLPLTLVTLMPDGQPQASVVWADWDGEHILVNTARGRQKERNMRTEPRVSLLVVDPRDQFRNLEIRGRVVEITTEGALEHRALLREQYLAPNYKAAPPPAGEVRVIAKIEPLHVRTEGK
jgi:PPOX class probable F420-dependent enzyme